MTWRLYVLPLAGAGTRTDPRRAAYLRENGVTDSALMDYGASPWCLCAADTTDTQDAAITANADARALPADLDQDVGGALTTVQNYLEAAVIPAQWITDTTPFRTVVRAVAGLMQFAARYAVLNNGDVLIVNQAALDLRVNQLSAARRNALTATATDLGYDTSMITGQTLIRAVLYALALQWVGREFTLGGLTF